MSSKASLGGRRARRRQRAVLTLMLAAVIGLAGCGSDREAAYVERPVGVLYNTAMDALLDGRTLQAAKLFDEVERQHPYSVWATKAQLMAAYSLYQSEKYSDAILALDRFIQLHPSNPDAAYAYYLKGLCYYEQISDVGRDQRSTQLALKALDEVVRRFPDSEFSRDARLKIDLTYDHLAGKEMDVGRFYLRQRHYLAAINRFRAVVDQYQTTSHAPEALHRLAECYRALGMLDEARKVAAVLGHNYPGSEWYDDSYQLVEKNRLDGDIGERGWFRRALGSIF
ncbi:MAG: outer membrane protein assembly factor BamD [Alphaproteobacteria bacterium]|nr:outer membrane protein assembly factor BamD [Alphaproteobacteria bacterium]